MKSVIRMIGNGRGVVIWLLLLMVCAVSAAQDGARRYPLTLAAGSRLMIDAKINGHAVVALLDSAAEATLLDRKFAESLNLSGGQATAGQGSGQSTFSATLVDGVQLEAVGLSLANQTVAVADLTDVGHRLLGRPIEVILGREIFDASRLAIDIDGQRIAVVSRDQEPPGTRLELFTEHGVETVPARIEGGATVRATFDLGNGSEVLISDALARRMNLLADGREVRSSQGGGLGGETTRSVIKLRDLELAGRHFKEVEAAIDPQASASDLNLGISVLRHFRIVTDFANHAVWLEARD